MNLKNLTPLLEDAKKNHYAVGAFNYCNAETARAIAEEAASLRSPVMLITGPWELPLLGAKMLVDIAEWVADTTDVPVCLHLDHATEIEMVKECLDAGFPSVMIDASAKDFEENVRLTKMVVDMAHPKGVTVEGELGAIGRVGDTSVEGSDEASLADPEEAAEFVRRTGVDALAVAIGNAHGVYSQRPELDFELLQVIRNTTGVPLVLHGGSGTPSDQLRRAIDIGITKVNVASELGRAYLNAIHQAMAEKDGNVWYSMALADAKAAVRPIVGRWMKELGCTNRC